MATNKVGGDASDARERDIKTAPELTGEQDEQFETAQNTESRSVAEDDSIDETAMPDEPVKTTPHVAVIPPQMPKRSFWRRFAGWFGSHKKVSIPLLVVLVLGVLAAIPFTRYAIAGLFLKQQFTVSVVDSETKQPVTSAKVRIDNVEVTTDNKGRATAKVAVGKATVAVSKKYFKSAEQTVTVPILKQKDVPELRLQATGRQVSVKVTNKIGKKPLANVTIVAADVEAKTDTDGTATLVVPAGEEKIEATLKAEGFNDSKVTVQVMKGEAENSFAITPAGKIYFLSNQSGKLDVVKTNLDGTEREVVLAGTGREDKPNTSLLASRDWRFLALYARRDSDKPKVYLIDTQTGKLSVVDEGDAGFTLAGWSDHRLIYTVSRNNVNPAEPKRQTLKAFDATSQKLTTLDETDGDGQVHYEHFGGTYILENLIVYIKQWSGYGPAANHQHTVNTVSPDGKNKKVIKSFDQVVNNYYTEVAARPYKPQEIYILFRTYNGSQNSYSFFEYEDGQVKNLPNYTTDQFYASYTTYLVSPSGNRTFWSEERDGLPTFFIGNKNGEDEEKVAALAKYNAYGWYTDDYVLIAKEGSQLYIAPRGSLAGEDDLTKVTDYYRPQQSYAGYGYGYGGL